MKHGRFILFSVIIRFSSPKDPQPTKESPKERNAFI